MERYTVSLCVLLYFLPEIVTVDKHNEQCRTLKPPMRKKCNRFKIGKKKKEKE
jgi:hypothetical protein